MLKEEIFRFDNPKLGTSTYELITWVDAFDSRYKKFISHNTPNRTKIVLCYIVKDHHLHPILSKDLKQAACEANQKGAKNY